MDNDIPGEKRPYEKPVVKQVELRPEEAVLGACKGSAGAGGSGPGSSNCRRPAPCSSSGS
jgi:hypothetical protein